MGLVADLYGLLEAEGLAGSGTDWDLTERRSGDSPLRDRLVTISEDGGPEPEVPTSEGIGDGAMMEVGGLIKVRGNPGEGIEAATKAEAIHALLHGRLRQTMGDHYYERVKAMTGEPVFIGWDSRDRPEFTTAFRAYREVSP